MLMYNHRIGPHTLNSCLGHLPEGPFPTTIFIPKSNSRDKDGCSPGAHTTRKKEYRKSTPDASEKRRSNDDAHQYKGWIG